MMLKNPKNVLIAYTALVFTYTLIFIFQNKSNVMLLDSSGLGDFLSGFFAPMAFLYLLLGYKQQEKALNKTNQDLLKQLKIQKQMLDLQVADQKAKEHAALPIIDTHFTYRTLPFDLKLINPNTRRPYESFKKEIIMLFENSGEKVSQVTIKCISPFQKNIAFNRVLSDSKELKVSLSIKESRLEEYSQDGVIDLEILLEFVTNLGIRYHIVYEIHMSDDIDGNYFSYGGLLNITRCQ